MHSWRSQFASRGSIGLVVISLIAVACGSGATTAPTTGPTDGSTPAPSVEATEIPPDQVEGSLSVLEWSGYDATGLLDRLPGQVPERRRSNFEFGISDADIYGKMKAGDQSDVFHAYTGWLQFYVDEGLVAEIDTVQARQLGQGARQLQGPRPVQRQAVLRALGLGLHLDPLPHRQGRPRDRLLGGALRPDHTTATSRCGTTAPAR